MVQGVVVRWLAGALRLAISGLLWVVARLRAAARRLEGDGGDDSGDGSVRDAGARRCARVRRGPDLDRAPRCARASTASSESPISCSKGISHTRSASEWAGCGTVPIRCPERSTTFSTLRRIDAGHVVLDAQPFNLREAWRCRSTRSRRWPPNERSTCPAKSRAVPRQPVLGDVGPASARSSSSCSPMRADGRRRGVTILVWATSLASWTRIAFRSARLGPASRRLASPRSLRSRSAKSYRLATGLPMPGPRLRSVMPCPSHGGAVSLDAGEGRGGAFELVIAVETPARVLEESRARQQRDLHATGGRGFLATRTSSGRSRCRARAAARDTCRS